MGMSLLFSFFIFLGIYSFHFSKAKEPVCSKFSYEEQLLEKMIRTEIKVEMMVNEIKTTQDNVLSTLGEFSDKFAALKGNITKEMLERGDELQQKEELFQKLFEETRKNLTSAAEDQRKSLSQLQGKLERPPIAFYANYVSDLLLDKENEIIIFGTTFINEGAGYDTSTGIFSAPVGGLYQFLVHICAYYKKYAYIGLVLEDKVIAAGANYDKDTHTCNTVGAVVRVKSGQKVWVKATETGPSYRLYQSTNTKNTFSGVLINI